MTTPAEQLQILSVYTPPSVARLAFYNPSQKLGGTWRRFYAATAFADISGFTPLAEALAASGGRGAEELTAILNQVFEALITTVESYGGQVAKFGGDALSLVWPCTPETISEAFWDGIKAAFAMEETMAGFTTVSSSQREFNLRMKMALSAGEVLEV